MGGLRKFVDKIKPTFSEGGKLSFLASTFDAFETFLFVPNTTTSRGAHIRDCNDMKRTMIVVVVALMPALLFGMYNTGYQVGMTGWAAFWFGFLEVLPMIVVSYVVGLGIEFFFAQKRGHEVNEGFLISDSNERIRNAKVCRVLTKVYGLYFAPKNSKARNKSRLRPHQLRKYNLRSSVLDARANSRSWNSFFSILKGLGIDMRFNHAENSDKICGISFCQDEYSMAGSKLDRDLSFNSLCATLGNVAAELIIQPHQAIIPSGGGGGTNNEQGWRNDKDKDNQRNEPFYKTSKRRR